MKCYQCDKKAMFLVGNDDKQVPLCLDCRLKFVQMLSKQNEMLEREINYLTASMESIVGLPPFLPRFPEKIIIQEGDITLNNIKIDKSTIGVLNTGNIESIDMAVTCLHQGGNDKIGKAILELSEAILKQNEINDGLRNQLMELISAIATEATAPKKSQRKTILRPLIGELSTLIRGITVLNQIWQKVQPIIESLFH